jgi:hypothetical protein
MICIAAGGQDVERGRYKRCCQKIFDEKNDDSLLDILSRSAVGGLRHEKNIYHRRRAGEMPEGNGSIFRDV